ncbi:DUF5693 family protein [Marinicrinis lubricantis]|uniref:DUF5693 family protein n=1 Tax=Marinicrinis lubricantis TaxID=2086470 RepID=A0ABW1IKF0_9BACL
MALLQKWNKLFTRLLWILVILGMVSSLPLIMQRIETEKSANRVEMVFDYTDLVLIAESQVEPAVFIDEQLDRLKESGVTTLALYENTLADWQRQRLLTVYSNKTAAELTGTPQISNVNMTVLMFKDEAAAERLLPLIQDGFAARGIEVEPYSWPEGQPGAWITLPEDQARIVPLAPDVQLMDELRAKGFQIAVRLSDNRPFQTEPMKQLMQQLAEREVRWFIFGGDAVTGYNNEADKRSLTMMSEWMKEYNIGFALIETDPSRGSGQKGLEKLAYLTDYNVVRLHSIMEGESGQATKKLSDRILLAVEDRNIRMIYLNSDIVRDYTKAEYRNTLQNVMDTLSGEDGAVKRLEDAGFEVGQAEPFQYEENAWDDILKLVLVIGGAALLTLLIGTFVPALQIPVFLIGCIGAAGLYVLSSKLLLQAMALGVAIAAPSLSVILAIRWLRRTSASQRFASMNAYWRALVLFLFTCMVTGAAFFYVGGLLQGITYVVRIDLFRGISLLKLGPIAIVGLYYVFFSHQGRLDKGVELAKRILLANIKVIYVVAAGVLGVVGLYYLSRAGNAGQTLPFEMQFRSFLENTLHVRPRTQEFLIGHPLFIFAAYLVLKYRNGLYFMIFAVIGQLTMVNTFTHLHTPFWISGIRVTYGLVLGILLSVVYIVLWEVIVVKGWRKWGLKRKE